MKKTWNQVSNEGNLEERHLSQSDLFSYDKFYLPQYLFGPIWDQKSKISIMKLSLDGIFNLGLVVEDSGGSDRVRIEPKHFFFQSGSPVLTLRNVNYEKSLATEFIYKKVDTGFNKWKSEELNSFDDWSTNQVRTSRYSTIGNDKDIKSNFIAASGAIENTRRKRNETKSWRLDNDNFIIALNRRVDGSDDPDNLGIAEKDENFIDVNNILFE